MATNPRMPAEPVGMRANRKVIASLCSICGQGFELAEEVYPCGQCRGHHHVRCWEAHRNCATIAGEPGRQELPAQAVEFRPPVVLAAEERVCPSCARVIKAEALKCRFCSTVLDQEFVRQIEPKEIPGDIASEVEESASKSLTYSIVGIFLCGIILEPIAIAKGYSTLKTLREYPAYAASSSARGKARAGLIIGWIVAAFWVIGIIANMAKS